MSKTLRDTIREITLQHLINGYSVMGQCLSAVGFVANTVPDDPRLTELPMSDVAGSGFVVGAALMGKRPILILRYQGFAWLNASFIVNYAAKSKVLWGRPCPMLIRSIAMEDSIGPTSGSSHHSLFLRMPGIKIYSPMTPWEWKVAYNEFMEDDGVVYLSEHRKAYDNSEELQNEFCGGDITLYPISITRFAAREAAIELRKEGVNINLVHIQEIKPLYMPYLSISKIGIVLDDDYPDGTAKAIAQDIHNLTGARMYTMGLENRTAGFAPYQDNLPPNKERIMRFVRELVR